MLGVDTAKKPDVRQLKWLGLTEGLNVGHRVFAARGRRRSRRGKVNGLDTRGGTFAGISRRRVGAEPLLSGLALATRPRPPPLAYPILDPAANVPNVNRQPTVLLFPKNLNWTPLA